MSLTAELVSLTIPSPSQGVWELGPIPIRGYALCIIAGIVAAVVVGEWRWRARGGRPGEIGDMALWAVPFGIIGGRIYHVITDYERYFGEGKNPVTALYIWQGGLGIWGAIALGGVGAWVYTRRHQIRTPVVADVIAPGLLVAQGIGRWGNWFNQELFGRPLDAWWALEIDLAHRPDGYAEYETFHPTFLYESIWNLAAAALVIWVGRRWRIGYGRLFALYVMAYCAGRVWIEGLRIDPVQVDDLFGLRLNEWTSIVLFVGALVYFVVMGRLRPGREDSPYRDGRRYDGVAQFEGDGDGRSSAAHA